MHASVLHVKMLKRMTQVRVTQKKTVMMRWIATKENDTSEGDTEGDSDDEMDGNRRE